VNRSLSNVIGRNTEGHLVLEGPLSRSALITEALVQYANHFTNLHHFSQDSFFKFIESCVEGSHSQGKGG
jgi:hypothetical protein